MNGTDRTAEAARNIESIPDLAWRARADGAIVMVNRRFTAFTGLADTEFSADGWAAIIHPDDAPAATADLRAALGTRSPFTLDFRLRRADGTYRWMLVRGQPLDATQRRSDWIGVATDIHELRRDRHDLRIAQQRLVENTALVDAIEHASADGIAFLDRRMRVVRVNSTLAAGADRTDTHLLGQHATELFPRTWTLVEPLVARVIATGQPLVGHEMAWPGLRDGEATFHRLSIHPVRVRDEITGVVLLAADVTAERRRAEQLVHTQRQELAGRLAREVAHDFNNLLAVVALTTEKLLRRSEDPVATRDLDRVLAAGRAAADLNRDLLAFTRDQAGTAAAVDLNRTLTDLRPLLESVAGREVELAFDLAPDLPLVMADRATIAQAVLSLAMNATEAITGTGKLQISTTRIDDAGEDPARVGLWVTDTGSGMTEPDRAQALDPFFTTRWPQRSGLGLSTAATTLQALGGSIRIVTTGPAGTVIAVELPAAPAVPDTEPSPHESMRRGPRVLLVEDTGPLRDVLAHALTSAGYHVLAAADGGQALALVALAPVDLLVTDVVMPGLSGEVLANRLTELRPGLPVVFMSGHPRSVLDSYGPTLRSHPVLSKPFSVESLLDAMAEALDPQPSDPDRRARA